MSYLYQNQRFKLSLLICLSAVFTFLIPNEAVSQTTISTVGTNYTGANGIAAPSAASVTFAIQNTGASAVTLTQIDCFWKASQTGAVPKLWYSATSLSGAPTIATPAWTLITTGTALTVAADGIIPTLTGLTFSIPAGTQYRFAIESNNGVSYSGSNATIPTPNNFTASGVNLQVGNFQIAGSNVGYGGGFPSPANTPRFFTGSITFTGGATAPPPSCATGLSPANAATGVLTNGGISWTAVSDATSYDVYLGTTANPAFVINTTSTSYNFTPNLNLSTTYYYKIVPRNGSGPATGCTVNSFTTTNCLQPTLPTLSPDTTYCGNASATLRVVGGSLNSATAWNWYTGSCGGTLVGTGNNLSVTPTTTTTYYVRAEGGCATAGSCASVTVTKTTSIGAPTINPVATICTGSLAALSINSFTLGTTPIADSITVNSGTISVAVPDNISTGATANITIPALPVGSIMTGIDITLNMVHTYPGDMIFNLQAPNGKIINLYKYNGGTFTGAAGGLPGAGWFNTVVSSNSTFPFSSGPASYNYGVGPYAPDTLNAPVTGVTVQNPNGYVSTENNFTTLYSVPNGTWTLAMADGGPGDLGTLTRWSIKIRYNKFAQVPSPAAIWAPAAGTPSGTLYTDAAGTTPYDGVTPTFNVYAKALSNSTYTAYSVSGTCTSSPVPVNVTVFTPVSLTSSPEDKTVCQSLSTSFSAAFDGTSPAYKWYVDNGSGTYTAISNDANYSGATTSTLTLNDIPASWNGYKYRCEGTSASPCATVINSNAAILNVNPTPLVSLTASPYSNLMPGMISTLTVSSNPAGAAFSWTNNGLPVNNATLSSINVGVDEMGIYKATVTDINGCVNTTEALKIGDLYSSRLFIYPNPNNGQFQVRYYSLEGNKLPRTLMIYDAKGALVLNKSFSISRPYDRMDVDFSGLSKGVYMVNLLNNTGQRIAAGKVVVK